MFCPKCGAEHQKGFKKCTDCGLKLVKNKSMKKKKDVVFDTVVLTDVKDNFEAEILVSELQKNGVECLIKAGVTPGSIYNPEMPVQQSHTAWKEILVNKEKLKEAKAVLKRFKNMYKETE